MGEFKIHTLGCGSAKPTVHHQPSSTVVEHHGTLYMVDCGEGAQLQFQKQRLKFNRLRHIFITHLHGDHVLGLPGLISTMALGGKEGKLTVHTFDDGKEILQKILEYFSRDLPFELEWNVITPESGIILDTGAMTISTVPLQHRVPDVGYIFREHEPLRHINRAMCDFHGVPLFRMREIKEGADFVKSDGTIVANELLTTAASPARSYAHISDTRYIPGLGDKLGPVDLLFHETTYLSDHADLARERFHSTAAQAATVARDAGVGRLLTGHYSSRYTDDSLFVKEAMTIFPDVLQNREGLTVDVRR